MFHIKSSAFTDLRVLLAVLAASGAGIFVACGGDTGSDDGSSLSDETGAYDACTDCPTSITWDCGCGEATVCAATHPLAVEECKEFCETTSDDVRITPCGGYQNQGSCGGWSPTSNIILSGGVYYVDESWFASVVNNPAPLWTCDDALVNPVAGGGFRIANASIGEMLYQLGLRNGDKLLSLNGLPLLDYKDASDAWFDLYLDAGETNYTLVVKRGTNNIVLNYALEP